jgi:hypothetical protein
MTSWDWWAGFIAGMGAATVVITIYGTKDRRR